MGDTRDGAVDVKDEPMPLIKPIAATPTRPPLPPTDRGRKRSRSSERYSGGGGGGGATTGEYHTPSRLGRESGGIANATPPLAMTPLPSPPLAREPIVYKDTMLSDSDWEREIAEFGRQLDDMLARVTDRQLVAQTAQYMRAYPQHSLRFQIKIKQRALTESPRQAQVKLMLFYLFHEFLKLFEGDELRQVQRDWYLTIDEVLHACMRDMRNNPDMKKRIFKTVARWEELGIYVQKTKQWKALSAGDAKPRRSLIRLPRTEAERLAEAPDQLQQFPPPPVNQPLLQVNRTNYPYVFERTNFRTAYELKQHWRFSAVAFIDVLAQCLGISPDIALTASMFFHRVFDRGIYAKERFKFAAACIFLSAKAASKRMKLIRMVKTMHEILELPLLAGDEEILDIERMQLLYYEIEVLKGVDFDLTTDMPFYYLKETLDQMPEKFRHDVEEGAQSVLEELFWLPLCLSIKPRFLAEAAAYISCRNKDRIFSFSWCREDKDGKVLTEKAAKDILKDYRELVTWKKDQRRHFDDLVRTSASAGGHGPWELQEVFQSQRGGLRIDVTSIQHEMEYTQKGVNESRAVLETYVKDEDNDRSNRDGRRNGNGSSSSYARRRDDDDVKIKTESRSTSTRYDDRGSSRDSYRHDSSRSNGNDRDRYRSRGDDKDRDHGGDRDGDRGRNRDRDRDRDRDQDRDRDRDRDRNRDRDRERDRDRDRERERERERYRDRGGDRNRDQDRAQDRHSSRRKDTPSDDDRFRVKQEPGVSSATSDRDDKKDLSRDYSSTRDRDRDRSPRRSTDDGRRRDSDRDSKRSSYKDRDRDDTKTRDSRDREREPRDRDHSTRDRDDKYSSRSRHSRSRSPRDSSRSSKRKDHSSSRSKSRSRERSSHTSRKEDRNDRERDRGRDRKRSYSPYRGREGDKDRRDDRNDKKYSDRESVKIKEESRRS